MTEEEIQNTVRENSLRSAVEAFVEMPDKSIHITRHVFQSHLQDGVDPLDGVYLGSNIFLDWIREASLLDAKKVGLDVISLTIPDTWLLAECDDLSKLRVPPPYLSVTLFKIPIAKEVHLKKKPSAGDVVPGVFEQAAWSERLFNQSCRKNLEQFDLWRSTPPKTHEFVEHGWIVFA